MISVWASGTLYAGPCGETFVMKTPVRFAAVRLLCVANDSGIDDTEIPIFSR